MIENRAIAVALLVLVVSGMTLYALYQSPLGPVLTILGAAGFFAFNRKG